jgi:hypothetical protein
LSRRAVATDAVLAAGLAALVLVLSSGVALAAVIALVVLALGLVSFGVEAVVLRRRGRRRR